MFNTNNISVDIVSTHILIIVRHQRKFLFILSIIDSERRRERECRGALFDLFWSNLFVNVIKPSLSPLGHMKDSGAMMKLKEQSNILIKY